MKKLLAVAAAAFAALVTSSAFADVYLVEKNPNAAAPYDSWATAATNLAEALSCLESDMTLYVSNGTYKIKAQTTLKSNKSICGVGDPAQTIFKGISVGGATFTLNKGSVISGVTFDGMKNSGHNFSGIAVSGGTLTNCTLRSTTSGNNTCGALQLYSGLVVDCTLTGSRSENSQGFATAAEVSGGVMDRCRVLNTSGVNASGKLGTICVSGTSKTAFGTVRNTLVAGSKQGGCLGIYVKSYGVVENCTVVDNRSLGVDGKPAVYVAATTAKVRNTLVYGNVDRDGTTVAFGGVDGYESALTDCFAEADGDPLLVDMLGGDYHLMPNSPCRDVIEPTDEQLSAKDLDGNARVFGAKVDIGAYEFTLPDGPAATVFHRIAGDWRFDPQTNELSAVITPAGASCDPATCYWTFDGTEPSAANHQVVGLTVTNAFGVGMATVRFRATVDGVPVAADKADWFEVACGFVYVDKNSTNPQPPYSSWETAAKNHRDAFAYLGEGMTMIISDGSYIGKSGTTYTLPRNSTVRSLNGPGTVMITNNGNNNGHVFSLANYGATIEGLDMLSGHTEGGTFDMTAKATVTNCVIRDISSSWKPFLVSAGTVVDCVFKNCAFGSSTDGLLITATGTAIIDRCRFLDNKKVATTDIIRGVVYVSDGATVRNSLFVGNTLPACSAIYVGANGRAENCTVVKNASSVAKGTFDDVAAVYAADPTASIVNVLAVENRDVGGAAVVNTAAASGAEECFTTCHEADSVLDAGVKFTDPAAGDYSLQAKSVCVNVGTPLDWMDGALDLAGNPRIARDVPDIGAYEYTPSTEVGVTLNHVVVDGRRFAPQLTEFAAEVTPEGAECDPTTCYWTFDGREPTEGDHDAVGLTVTNTVGIGTVTVRFRATVNGQPISADEEDWYVARGEFVYVDTKSANPQPPYLSLETSAKTVTDAFPYLEEGMTLLIADGTYYRTGNVFVLPQNTVVRSVNGPGSVTFARPGNDMGRVFQMPNTGCRIEGIRFSLVDTDGGPVVISGAGSVVSNCVFNNGGTVGNPWQNIVSATAGTIIDCVFTNCNACTGIYGSGKNQGIAVTASGANTVIDRCVFAGNTGGSEVATDFAQGIVRVTGGATVRNCLFKNNTVPFCTIYVGANGHAENCTVVGNAAQRTKGGDETVGAVFAVDAAASVVNVLTVGNADSEEATANASGEEAAFDHCFTEGDPLFKNAEKSNFHLKGASPCLNAGAVLPWMAGATDLDGNPRIRQSKPDIGCYEDLQKGLSILVR